MEQKTYVCKRARMCSYLVACGFEPYKIKPDNDNPRYNVYLFTATPELYRAVMAYVADRQHNDERSGTNGATARIKPISHSG